MAFDRVRRTLELEMDGGYLIEDPIVYLGRGFLKFSNWSRIKITSYDALTSAVQTRNDIEKMQFVSEDSYSPEVCIIKGFSASSGHWIEITMEHPIVEGEFGPR